MPLTRLGREGGGKGDNLIKGKASMPSVSSALKIIFDLLKRIDPRKEWEERRRKERV